MSWSLVRHVWISDHGFVVFETTLSETHRSYLQAFCDTHHTRLTMAYFPVPVSSVCCQAYPSLLLNLNPLACLSLTSVASPAAALYHTAAFVDPIVRHQQPLPVLKSHNQFEHVIQECLAVVALDVSKDNIKPRYCCWCRCSC